MSTSFQRLTINREKKNVSSLNLVALMDIFTVLVFFLLFNVHDEQGVVMGQHVSNLPLSTQAVLLDEESDIQVLELANDSVAYFAEQKISVSDGFEAVREAMTQYCQEVSDTSPCQRLAIEAPPELSYSFVNRFIELGRSVGFENVYLVVAQK
ncbi:ExbD/TolR family protein [Vibrio parahaemolyticus]|nr:biopolymer transporter ExbD [Vibrio parahaemolyticus]EIA1343585.1 biopolymer transporter ExbD [Vibrio parahaemolyticus]EIA1590643.1 biopolymer transporter ExbD [Vibrio parahaemolyticus]EIA1769754.1 biopolymer transporter ExbD [Vibrio parahaemolyticus]EJG0961856.1 biopolymer transporter ExbD [Vibrio parahaemolyticus]